MSNLKDFVSFAESELGGDGGGGGFLTRVAIFFTVVHQLFDVVIHQPFNAVLYTS